MVKPFPTFFSKEPDMSSVQFSDWNTKGPSLITFVSITYDMV